MPLRLNSSSKFRGTSIITKNWYAKEQKSFFSIAINTSLRLESLLHTLHPPSIFSHDCFRVMVFLFMPHAKATSLWLGLIYILLNPFPWPHCFSPPSPHCFSHITLTLLPASKAINTSVYLSLPAWESVAMVCKVWNRSLYIILSNHNKIILESFYTWAKGTAKSSAGLKGEAGKASSPSAGRALLLASVSTRSKPSS